MAKRKHEEDDFHVTVADFLAIALPKDAVWTTIEPGGKRNGREGSMNAPVHHSSREGGTWTEARVARLTELWLEGVSAGVIGKQMGLSKNTIVGKAHRLELAGRPSPILRNVPRSPKREERLDLVATVDKSPPISESVAPVPAQANPNSAPICQPPAPQENEATVRSEEARVARAARAARAQSATQRWKVSQAQAKADQNIRRNRGQDLLPWSMRRQFTLNTSMRFRECQFIAGEPSGDDSCKCRAEVGASRLYCLEHETKIRRTRLAWGEAP